MSKLTREQRSELLDGGFPKINGEGDCPFPPAKAVYLSSRFWIVPTATHNRIKGRVHSWRLEYTVHDHRDRYLGAAPVVSEAERQSKRWSHDAAHGYTSNPYAPLADAGTAVDRSVQEQQTKDANRKWALHIAQDRRMEIAQQQARTINNKIKRLIRDGAELEIDVTPKLAATLRDIENDISKARREVS